ncbi:MAG: fructose-bisphosphatase class III, partial [Oscillospiraceae bacterium]
KDTHEEPKNAYYKHTDDLEVVENLLEEFGLNKGEGHIINGHIPVKSKDGESPIKSGGRLLCIDGGFCKAYQPTTGIAGYTLIYNSYGLRLVSHEPFDSIEAAVRDNTDILSTSNIFEISDRRRLVADTDTGRTLRGQITALGLLLDAYRSGALPEQTHS